MEQFNLFPGKPVPLIGDLIRFHFRIVQQFDYIDMAVLPLYQLDIGVDYSAVVQRIIFQFFFHDHHTVLFSV